MEDREKSSDINDVQTFYRVRSVCITPKHKLYDYCSKITLLTNTLYNATCFRQRQVITAVKKRQEELTRDEQFVLEEIRSVVALLDPEKYQMVDATHYILSYQFLEKIFSLTQNPDYLATGLPRQTAQQVIRQCVDDFSSFFRSLKAYRQDPSKFCGIPQLPGYHEKDGHTLAAFTNQQVVLRRSDNENCEMKIPFSKVRVSIGKIEENAVLKSASILPQNNIYVFAFCFEIETSAKTISPILHPSRIAAIDLGVENLMAITNNANLPCLLYKGSIAKEINQLYNKKVANVMSNNKQMIKENLQKLALKRNHQMADFLHKVAKHFISWCVCNNIDTIVVGRNRLWKQKTNMGSIRNQIFIQIPYGQLKSIIAYLAEENGICFLQQEEAYTSKASFLDNDLPQKGTQFSGKRAPTRYKGRYKRDGFRGLYQTKSGRIINSDLNASANILKAAFPDAFTNGCNPDFNRVVVITHPDFILAQELKERQKKLYQMSKSKKKRLQQKNQK